MFHLSDPGCWIQAIKFVHLNFGKMGVMREGVGMQVQRPVGVNIFSIERWVRGGRTLEFVHELLESGIDFNNLAT
jgi:hypothetical protein